MCVMDVLFSSGDEGKWGLDPLLLADFYHSSATEMRHGVFKNRQQCEQ
jgi:hypothetical protein